MAGPLHAGNGVRSASASAATISPALPVVQGAAGALLAVVASKNLAVHTTATAGWSMVGLQVNSGLSFTASLWIAAGDAAAPTFTWTGAAACSAQVAYYTDPSNVTETTVGSSTNNNGATATHSTSAINTSRNDSLVVYIDVAAANTALGLPAGWTEDSDSGSATDAGRTVFGSKPITTSGTSSGAISVTGANAAWVQWQVELRGQLPTGFQVSEEEVGAWLDPVAGFVVSEVEVGAWSSATPRPQLC